MFSEGFAGNGTGNETSTRYSDAAILAKYALPFSNTFLEDFATALPMLTPTKMTVKVTWGHG